MDDSKRFTDEIDKAYGRLVPGVAEYDYCFWRHMITLDTYKLG